LSERGNCFIIFLAAFVGYFVSGGTELLKGLLVSVSAALIAAGGNVINDYFDKHIDLINKPWRPLLSGRISESTAYFASIFLFTVGITIGFMFSLINGLAAVLASCLLYMYSHSWKKEGILGNLIIGFLSSMSILYGGFAGVNPFNTYLLSLYAFLIIFGREILKGIEDIEGDKKAGVKTLAVIRGPSFALKVATVILLAVVLLSSLSLLAKFEPLIVLLVVAGVDLPIIVSLLYVYKDPIRRAWRTTRLLKFPLLFGLLSFLLIYSF